MALVVPEGFLFKKELAGVRAFLLSKAKLQSVISLPQGTFLPYTGVKTSILYFTDAHRGGVQTHYWYFEASNIGVTLNSKKQKIKGLNDLNKIEASDIKTADNNKENMLEIGFDNVDIGKVRENDYNLIGSVYKTINTKHNNIQIFNSMLQSGLIIGKKGKTITKETAIEGNIPVIAGGQSSPYRHNKSNYGGNIITISASGAYSGFAWYHSDPIWASDCNVVYSGNETRLLTEYLFYVLKAQQEKIYENQHGSGQPHIYLKDLNNIEIPLISIENQRSVIDELDSYEKIIDGAQQIIDMWRPSFNIDTSWDIYRLRDLCNICRGGSPRPIEKYITSDEGLNWLKIGDVSKSAKYITSTSLKITKEGLSKTRLIRKGSLILSNSMSFGRPYIVDIDLCIHDGWLALQDITQKVDKNYLYYVLKSAFIQNQFNNFAVGSTVKNLNISIVSNVQIPLPPIHIQQKIAEDLEIERKMIELQKDTIQLFQNKIDNKLNSLWQSDTQSREETK